MSVGVLRQTEDNRLQGELAMWAFKGSIQLLPNEARENQKAPTHTVVSRSPITDAVTKLGAAWAGNHKDYGHYVSINLENPEVFKTPISLMTQNFNNGEFDLDYSRQKAQAQAA